MKGRLILGVMVAAAVVFGVSGVAFSDSSPTIKGMVGGDFDIAESVTFDAHVGHERFICMI